MGTIYARKRNGTTYYVYQEAYRIKIDPLRSGKTNASGKSTVRTKVTYLGTAQKILNALRAPSLDRSGERQEACRTRRL